MQAPSYERKAHAGNDNHVNNDNNAPLAVVVFFVVNEYVRWRYGFSANGPPFRYLEALKRRGASRYVIAPSVQVRIPRPAVLCSNLPSEV